MTAQITVAERERVRTDYPHFFKAIAKFGNFPDLSDPAELFGGRFRYDWITGSRIRRGICIAHNIPLESERVPLAVFR